MSCTLLAKCANEASSADIRDSVILTLIVMGLWQSDIVRLDLINFSQSTGTITIPRRNKIYPLPTKALGYLNQWVEVRGNQPGPLLYPISKKAELIRRRLVKQFVSLVLHQRSIVGVPT